MNATDPYPQSKFAIDGQDILLSELVNSASFAVEVIGRGLILEETYNFDNDGQASIRGIADLISKCLYGELVTGKQENASRTTRFYFDDVCLYYHKLYASRFRNPHDPNGRKYIMAVATRKSCHPGHPFYVTAIGQHKVVIYNTAGEALSTVTAGASVLEGGAVYTTDYDPALLFPNHYRQAAYMVIRNEMRVDILPLACQDAIDVRFLNRYDVMESLTAMYMTEKPTVQDDVSLMGGRRTRFSVKSNTDYTLFSGRLNCQEEFDTWQDLLTSRKAQIYWKDQWVDIIITKGNYTRQRRQFYGSQVEISFQTANPLMLL